MVREQVSAYYTNNTRHFIQLIRERGRDGSRREDLNAPSADWKSATLDTKLHRH
jgi:hypothetical protein